MPACATQAYETLRAAVVEGHPYGSGAAALRFHGMFHGLAIITGQPTTVPVPTLATSSSSTTALPREHAFVRLLANLVLRTNEELMHVY